MRRKSVVKCPFSASREQLEFNACEQRNPDFFNHLGGKANWFELSGGLKNWGVKLQCLTGEGSRVWSNYLREFRKTEGSRHRDSICRTTSTPGRFSLALVVVLRLNVKGSTHVDMRLPFGRIVSNNDNNNNRKTLL